MMDNGLLFCEECTRCIPNEINIKTKNNSELQKHYKTRNQEKISVNINESDNKKKQITKSYLNSCSSDSCSSE